MTIIYLQRYFVQPEEGAYPLSYSRVGAGGCRLAPPRRHLRCYITVRSDDIPPRGQSGKGGVTARVQHAQWWADADTADVSSAMIIINCAKKVMSIWKARNKSTQDFFFQVDGKRLLTSFVMLSEAVDEKYNRTEYKERSFFSHLPQ